MHNKSLKSIGLKIAQILVFKRLRVSYTIIKTPPLFEQMRKISFSDKYTLDLT